MKPLYSPAEVQFRVMKNQPPDDNWYCDRYNHTEWWCFWGKKGTDVVNKCCLPEFKAPFLPGEKCYLRETWALPLIADGIEPNSIRQSWIDHWRKEELIWYKSAYKPDPTVIPLAGKGAWRSPVTMPLCAARRFFAIVSCTPMQIGEVTAGDCRRAGCEGPLTSIHAVFKQEWERKHPGTWPGLWVWRIAIQPSGISG